MSHCNKTDCDDTSLHFHVEVKAEPNALDIIRENISAAVDWYHGISPDGVRTMTLKPAKLYTQDQVSAINADHLKLLADLGEVFEGKLNELTAASDRALMFLASTPRQDQPRDVQRQWEKVTRELGAAIARARGKSWT